MLMNIVVLWIRIQLFIRMRIRIQGAKPMEIHSEPDPGQSLKSKKDYLLHLKYTLSR